ncbi:hypothetical protein M3Y98_00471300 [Aphelenchoides besseyi]|nr:hypothetical protein M3Y98_00471300 [Aphelenchoides besseyi]KAI6207574.1 hypothetical protein M3Y96_00023400 [Aphelenchoides besseyi]
MKRRPYAPNSIITVSNEIDDYSARHASRQVHPMHSVRTYRQVDSSQLRRPITLPRWARSAYRQPRLPAVPQLIPEIRVMPLDNLVVYEGGEEEQVEIDPDDQIDVCALEDEDTSKGPSHNKRARMQQESSGLVKEEKLDNEEEQSEGEQSSRTDRCRILRRSNANAETLASRARRENKNWQEDEVMAEFGEVLSDSRNELIQEVEIVDQDEQMARYMYGQGVPMAARRVTYANPRAVVNLNELYDEMSRYAPKISVSDFNDLFGTESSMSHPLNVKSLMSHVKNSSSEQNARIIAALAMQVNYMKREISKIREEIVDTRSVTFMRQNHGITNRNLDLTAKVTENWFIDVDPPLRKVDLVKTARDVSLRIGRKNMKTRDVITRFVRAVFEQMIPEDLVREYTVRDRPSTRGQSKDIGIKAKNQIIGIILDLMSLYHADVLDKASRHDRANFSDTINQTMKTVIYDMRRISPKSRKTVAKQSKVAQDNLEDIEEEELED